MESFSERYGYKEKKPFQLEGMDNDLRVGLWNVFQYNLWSRCQLAKSRHIGAHRFGKQPVRTLVEFFWCHHMKRPVDDLPVYWEDVHRELKDFFFKCTWNEAYDAVEVLARAAHAVGIPREEIDAGCNRILEQEQSGYRFVKGMISPVVGKPETSEIELALCSPYDSVRLQIQSAVEKLSEKPSPDLRNCIKESIGAVETAVKLASSDPNGTLGTLLPKLKEKLGLHTAQVAGFEKLYGYTSDDEAGIRHGMMGKDNLTVDDARYMLVTCSAFSNYVLNLSERAGILPSPD